MENRSIELELRKLGLTEKEARVYLAGLELGPGSVQKIAETVGIPRPTAYQIIRKLEEKKLFVEVKQAKKIYFTAQSPGKILGLLRVQKRELEEKEREFIRIISALDLKYSLKGEVKIFKGKEGLKALEEIISFSSTPDLILINQEAIPIKADRRKIIYKNIEKRLGKITIKEINAKIDGSLIIFDKVIFFPPGNQEGILF
jgi:HTH-type transcriptional regulator, sugar sensing transcriptional regulator